MIFNMITPSPLKDVNKTKLDLEINTCEYKGKNMTVIG